MNLLFLCLFFFFIIEVLIDKVEGVMIIFVFFGKLIEFIFVVVWLGSVCIFDKGDIIFDVVDIIFEICDVNCDMGDIVFDMGDIICDMGDFIFDMGDIICGMGDIIFDMGDIIFEMGDIIFVVNWGVVVLFGEFWLMVEMRVVIFVVICRVVCVRVCVIFVELVGVGYWVLFWLFE